MEKKFCVSCGQTTWHNLSGKKEGVPRCTYCGAPVSTNIAKREFQEALKKKQVAKVKLV